MRKALKWVGILLGGLVGLLILVVAGLLIYGQLNFKRTYDRPVYAIVADNSPEGMARGKYLIEAVMACDSACHSPEGKPFVGFSEPINFGPISGIFATPNITPDEDTGIGNWTDGEIARAIREGLDKDGVELVIMPSYNYHALSDADVAAVVGYLRNLEPVHNEVPPFQVNAVGKVMVALQMFGPRSLGEPYTAPMIAPTVGTAQYGSYLVSLAACRDCHGQELTGGEIPFAEAGTPKAPNLTLAGNLAAWSEADFLLALRNGLTPDGRMLDPEWMPWPDYGQMTDEDLIAIFKYLQTLPPI
jgi:mono/diheme cytochrome c family protein